jgi:hypothetical protein
MRDRRALWLFGLLAFCGALREANAALILGDRISLTPTTFALPINVIDAVGLTSWTFDLTYDPTDVLINTACDPFAGDPYCSLMTGPVTEGDFFAAGAPFNLLVPGFIALDPATQAQSGSLFGVHGAFGGFGPAPSGSGTLAYIQFTLLGGGDSPIDVGGDDPPVTPVAEPGTLALVSLGIFALGSLRLRRRGLLPVTLLLVSGSAVAQVQPPVVEPPTEILQPTVVQPPPVGYPPTTAVSAAGPYLATPAWDQTLATNVRFVILTNLNGDAVLDRETGLVWARQSAFARNSFEMFWDDAQDACHNQVIAGRGGWRLPTAAEFQTLIDFTIPETPNQPRLPAGHPFLLPSAQFVPDYWTSEISDIDDGEVFFVKIVPGTVNRYAAVFTSLDATKAALCVRGRE